MPIYCITNMINNKKYVGQTKTLLKYRITSHLKQVSDGSMTPLHCAIRKYGIDNFNIETIDCCKEFELNDREIFWIKKLNTLCKNGYNIRLGGVGKQPDDLNQRIRNSLCHRRIPITQYDVKTGNIINVFDSICEAGRQTGIAKSNIGSCVKNPMKKTAGGFAFVYKQYYDSILDKSKLIIYNYIDGSAKRGTPVYGIKGDNKINFNSIKDAAAHLNCSYTTIIGSITHNYKCRGYKWYYTEE